MLSYHNDTSLKERVVNEMLLHVQHDQLIKGTYDDKEGEKYKGCAVGCVINSLNIIKGQNYEYNNHAVFEDALGIPEWLAHLQDVLFENLPLPENAQFAVDFLNAIPIGVNLDPIKHKFCAFLIQENIESVSNLNNLNENIKSQVLDILQKVLKIHNNAIITGEWNQDHAKEAAAAAWSAWSAAVVLEEAVEAALAAVRVAARAAAGEAKGVAFALGEAARAGEVAAWEAARAVRAASWAARAARAAVRASRVAEEAWVAAEINAYKRYAEHLLKLLQETSSQ